MSNRIDVKKTYKLYINGAFPRSESGRTYEVKSAKGAFIANPPLIVYNNNYQKERL